VPWCRFFIPKIASSNVKADDPDLNDHIMYAKCVKGHVIRDAQDWILCENLPASDAKCWKEGGDTIFSLRERARKEVTVVQNGTTTQKTVPDATPSRKGK
jgi:hypothetical protein